MVLDFLQDKLLSFSNVEDIVFLSDAAGGQNKNTLMSSFCTWFAYTKKINITQLFPVRGHSYGQCDRNFGILGNKLKKIENIYCLDEYINIFKTCRQNPSPFIVKYGTPLLRDMSASFQNIFLKKPTTKNDTFKIQSYVKIRYNKYGTISAYKTYNNLLPPIPFKFFKNSNVSFNMDFGPAELGTLTAAKCADLESLFSYIPVDKISFFQDIIKNAQSTFSEAKNNTSEDSDDISDN